MTEINRREMLKMGSACSLAALATVTAALAEGPRNLLKFAASQRLFL